MNTFHSYAKFFIVLAFIILVSIYVFANQPIPESLLGMVMGLALIQSLVVLEYETVKR